MKTFQKLKNITKSTIDYSYDFEVEDTHRIVAKHKDSDTAFYTSNCWHPDIEEFIRAKQSGDRLQKFNLSVNCTDKFMEQLIVALDSPKDSQEFKAADSWDLIFPNITSPLYKSHWTGDINAWINHGLPVLVHKTVSITGLWELIMDNTYRRADPGVLFLDRANYFNPLRYAETILATNPCLRGDTKITLSDSSTMSISDIVTLLQQQSPAPIQVMNYNIGKNAVELDPITNAVLTNDNAELIELCFDDGTTLHLTPDHKVLTKERGYVAAKDLCMEDEFVNIVF